MSAAAISPTAYYTGQVWLRAGLSHPALASPWGRILFDLVQPANVLSRALGGPTLEGYLLARHRALDTLVEQAIEREGVSQVVEVACGLSPRGWRFARRYGSQLTYIEADLPDMAARKRRALAEIGSLSPDHRVVEVDALRESGTDSLAQLVGELDPRAGLAIVTEGLLGYLPSDELRKLWRRLAAVLGGFDSGRYISDLHLGSVATAQVQAFRAVLSAFVRGRVYLHFDSAEQARSALRQAGFAHVRVWRARDLLAGGRDAMPGDRGTELGRVIEASTSS